jgi:MFS family permease
VIPSALAVALLVLGVEEPRGVPRRAADPVRFAGGELRGLPAAFWVVVGIGVVFTFARFSEAFLVLRAREAGLPLPWVPAVMIAMNFVYAAVSAPAGRASDRGDRRRVLASGLAALIAAHLALAASTSSGGVLIGAALWGLHMGLTQGSFAALIADAAPASLRGTAFGVFHLLSGVALFLASSVAGILWQSFGSAAPFLCGAAISGLALFGLLALVRRGAR